MFKSGVFLAQNEVDFVKTLSWLKKTLFTSTFFRLNNNKDLLK